MQQHLGESQRGSLCRSQLVITEPLYIFCFFLTLQELVPSFPLSPAVPGTSGWGFVDLGFNLWGP